MAASIEARKDEPVNQAVQERTASKAALRAARIALAAVFVVNMQCAVQFVLWPDAFAPAYELAGFEGRIAMQGLGVAFLMWNATYPLAIANPVKHRALFGVVLAQQAIGLIGESAILASIPAGHELLASSILRFVAFDGAGLIAMALAFVALSVSLKRRKAA